MRRWLIFLIFPVLALQTVAAHAHKPSDSYLVLRPDGEHIEGQWDIALRDLDYAIGLDTDNNGEITWGELHARQDAVAAYALAHLKLRSKGADCPPQVTGQLVDQHSDGTYAVLRFVAQCPNRVDTLEATYSLFFDLDPQHKGLLRLDLPAGRGTTTAIFSPDQSVQRFTLEGGGKLQQFFDYLKNGVWHIWIGFDHILFLLSLLLPAVAYFANRRWQPLENFKPALWDVLRIVTAFTVAHSITLSLAALGVIQLPSRLVESAIALSVVLAAVNNIFPVVLGRRWAVAFFFGLIHGFGFASVLADLGLPRDALVLALVGFNVGVEIGQLAIVSAFLPLAYALRKTVFYRRFVLIGGSAAIMVVASIWLAERALDFKLISR
ncbi:MAG: HupE/UreJ family protein [Betaproteobacteria bacterium]|nr:HupE/UreJ family protein [Betaproteobacteria bacterium]